MEEPPPRAGGSKGSPLRAELDAKSGGLDGGGVADLWAWLAADGHGDDPIFTAGGLAHLQVWFATDGHGDGAFLAAAGGSPTSGLGSPLMAMEAPFSSPPPGGLPSSGQARR
jgi:hypothetical protein